MSQTTEAARLDVISVRRKPMRRRSASVPFAALFSVAIRDGKKKGLNRNTAIASKNRRLHVPAACNTARSERESFRERHVVRRRVLAKTYFVF